MGQLDFEKKLEQVQRTDGVDSEEYARCLEEYANFLTKKKLDLLKATNLRARADVIRESLKTTKPRSIDITPQS